MKIASADATSAASRTCVTPKPIRPTRSRIFSV
jgi:hypothetical protein